ncbi:TadE/TadG family type IV pilus assembly protein [Azospira restricta]|uniref:Pilus assembly protein n=1 Tax=Azospira restricta TaxID=404405 RepID=A0A974SNH9_9RHOO|nr:TadE/TadG family type IV pilus assembly protein [Azospira restricta]QRJ62918.1 pilus assembly protein [Azospira restricta]
MSELRNTTLPISIRKRSGCRRESGVAAVELAFLLVLLLLMAAGTFEFGRGFWYYNALAKATRDGARAMSMAPKATISSVAVGAAQPLVVNAANGANVDPVLVAGNVDVTCDGSACVDGTAPTNVRVAITGYSIDIGGIFPFFDPATYGVSSIAGVNLAPHTTMRYMN